MALVSCPECSHEISDSAFKCNNCGKQMRKPKRGFFGKLFKWSFIVFNVGMVVWLFSYMGVIGEGMDSAATDAESAGTAIGATLGMGMLVTFWALVDIILGMFVLFTRPKSG